MPNIVSWSGGKDSTATIILAHEKGIKIDLIITAFVWFDKSRKIYGDTPEKIDWINNCAKPIFESWGYPVKIVSSDKDYMHYFFMKRKSAIKHPEHIGKYYGFLIGGFCRMQREKEQPINQYLRSKFGKEYINIVGICSDEPARLERLHNSKNQRSILYEYGYTQFDAKMKCKEYNLLAPWYGIDRKRDGCWFCPNQGLPELAALKINHPVLWEELEKLSRVENTVARGFKYGIPFQEINRQVDEYIKNPPPKQLSLFDVI